LNSFDVKLLFLRSFTNLIPSTPRHDTGKARIDRSLLVVLSQLLVNKP